jgi:hypothetical protein
MRNLKNWLQPSVLFPAFFVVLIVLWNVVLAL